VRSQDGVWDRHAVQLFPLLHGRNHRWDSPHTCPPLWNSLVSSRAHLGRSRQSGGQQLLYHQLHVLGVVPARHPGDLSDDVSLASVCERSLSLTGWVLAEPGPGASGVDGKPARLSRQPQVAPHRHLFSNARRLGPLGCGMSALLPACLVLGPDSESALGCGLAPGTVSAPSLGVRSRPSSSCWCPWTCASSCGTASPPTACTSATSGTCS
jgi:hypothetical protein